MPGTDSEPVIGLAVALAIGLLLGAERERRMSTSARRAAGIRTFALAALMGGIAQQVGGTGLVVAGLVVIGAASVAGYLRTSADGNRGLTTEIALLVAYLLGVLAQQQPTLASAVAVAATILLAPRTGLHRLVSSVLTDAEVHDALLLAAAGVVILPMLPDRAVDPLGAVNPFAVWRLVVVLMAVSAFGYVVTRVVGLRYGLPIAGFIGGFISSTATIAAAASRARLTPDATGPAVAAALLSTVATMLQLAVVLAVADLRALEAIRAPLLAGGTTAGVLGALGVMRLRGVRTSPDGPLPSGRAFDLRAALGLGVAVTAVSVAAALLERSFGDAGVLVAASLGGFADVHATAIGVASLVASGQVDAQQVSVPLLAAVTSNTVMKLVMSMSGGLSLRFTAPVAGGLVLVVAATWAALLAA